jgi:hypothetical protein
MRSTKKVNLDTPDRIAQAKGVVYAVLIDRDRAEKKAWAALGRGKFSEFGRWAQAYDDLDSLLPRHFRKLPGPFEGIVANAKARK